MSKTYKNEKGVHYEGHTDKNGKIHVNIYDNDPKKTHSSIHINIDTKTGKGTIVEKEPGKDKVPTDTQCYLTSACMSHYLTNFDDNCYELTILRWFRDTFVSKEDIKHYYKTAPMIVESIEQEEHKDLIYNYIYDNVVYYCVEQIENGNYIEAYNRYKDSILSLEKIYIPSSKKIKVRKVN